MESFALEGKDLILARYFHGKQQGFFVDVGACHPTRCSNTYLFYLQGWRGINIDATPASMEEFRRQRPRDVNLEVAVSSCPGTTPFFCFEDPALNSFDESLSRDRERRGCKLRDTVHVRSRTLEDILGEHLPPDTPIDFLSVDVEGQDLAVLQSNDWERFRPEVVMVRCSAFGVTQSLDFDTVLHGAISSFLIPKGYRPFAKTFDSVLFKRVQDVPRLDFLDRGLWTPQTCMLRDIQEWVLLSDRPVQRALSIDVNPDLEAMVRGRWKDARIEHASYPAVDACDLGRYPDQTFDLVFSHQVLEHIPKPWLAAAEMTRVLKPGGVGIHTTCAFNPRHGQPHFQDYYRFLKEGLSELFEGVEVQRLGEWGNRTAILYNAGVDDGHGDLGGRRFHESVGSRSDGLYPWVTWIIFEKTSSPAAAAGAGAAAQRSHGGSVIEEDSHGIRFVLREYEKPYRENLVNRACDDAVFFAYELLLRKGGVVFDVGAHVGRYSVFPSRIVGDTGVVYAFEPVEENYWQLKTTLALNRCGNVIAERCAMGSSAGSAVMNLFDPEFSSWSSFGKPEMTAPDGRVLLPVRSETVPCDTVDAYCSRNAIAKIDFLKIDVEGHELPVLQGAREMLSKRLVDYICFEMSSVPLQAAGISAEQLQGFLHELGYHVYSIEGPPYRIAGPARDLSCFHGNFVATHIDIVSATHPAGG